MTYIYAHFFSNGDKYVGISNNPEQRWKEGFDSNNTRQYNHKVLIANEKYDRVSLVISEDLPRRIAEAMKSILINRNNIFNLNIKEEMPPNLYGNDIICIYTENFSHVYPRIDDEILYYSPEMEKNNNKKLEIIEKEVEKIELEENIPKKLKIIRERLERRTVFSAFNWEVPVEKLILIFKDNSRIKLKSSIEKDILSILTNGSKMRKSKLEKWVNEGYYDFVSLNIPKYLKFLDELISINFKDKKINELIKTEQYEFNILLETYNEKKENKKEEGCYIATSIYGSYDCPEVWILRRFRDNNLSKNIFGNIFIKIYYTTSPTLVNYFGETKLFKKIFKKILNKIVINLQDK